MTPFDPLASNYAALWSNTQHGVLQRTQVWREIDTVFSPGDHVLDIGCGIGDDAVHLMSRGIRVTAIDVAPNMVEAAQARGIDAHCMPLETLALTETFDGALCNFGVLNCVSYLPEVAPRLMRWIRPGGTLAVCVIARFWWRESLRFALRGNFGKATRRWSGHTRWRGIDVYYRSTREYRRAFAPCFTLKRQVPIGNGDHTLYLFERAVP